MSGDVSSSSWQTPVLSDQGPILLAPFHLVPLVQGPVSSVVNGGVRASLCKFERSS